MKGTKTVLLPRLTKILAEMGENIKLARLWRKLTAEQIAERAGIAALLYGRWKKEQQVFLWELMHKYCLF